MKTREISKSDIELKGTDAIGPFAMAKIDGEWVGVSLADEDECVRDLAEIKAGMRVECGTEVFDVIE